MAARFSGPTLCIETKPRKDTILLGAEYINFSRLREETGIDSGYLSRILRGKVPNVPAKTIRKIAESLGMTSDDLLTAIEMRAA